MAIITRKVDLGHSSVTEKFHVSDNDNRVRIYLVSSSTMTMGSSRWPGARKLYCLSLCFVNPVVNTCGDEHSQLPVSSEWTQRYNSLENLIKIHGIIITRPFLR